MVEGIYDFDEIKVLDGGFGSQISKKIERSIDGDVLWSARLLATNKEAVINTHLDFLRAGSDIIETNTYQASVEGFMKYLNLSEKESYNLIQEAVDLAKTARDNFLLENPHRKMPLIAGSVGPYGASLHDGSEYTGTYKNAVTKERLSTWHRPRIEALIESGVNILAFETLPCRIEAEVLLDVLKEFPDVKAWLSFNCKDGKSLASGENFQETVRFCYNLNPSQLLAIGANCVSPTFVEELFTGINKDCDENPIAFIVYPNSGEDYNKDEGWIGKDKCTPFEAYITKWLDIGVKWVGGCCRTYDTDIATIRKEVDQWMRSK